MGLGQIFQDPSFLQKLASNPKTAPYLGDPQFMEKLNRIRTNPSAIQSEISDPRVMQVIGVLLGIQMEMPNFSGAGGSASGGDGDVEMPDARNSAPPPRAATPPPPEPQEDEEEKAKKDAKEAADKEKALGTENYKKRNFDAAIEHYSKAWELHKDITYLNNLAAAKFEAGDYDGCIKECEKAIEEGREMRADFKLIAKYLTSLRFLFVPRD
jgi:stress-induced-phosphoprotein 1